MNTLTVDQWIHETLHNDATITNAVIGPPDGAAIGNRIYGEEAPEDVVFPFILFGPVGDPTDVKGVGTLRIQTVTPYVVRVVAKTRDYDDLAVIADRIDYLLDGRSAYGILPGKNVLYATREAEFRLTEKGSGVEIRHLGGRYTIAAQ